MRPVKALLTVIALTATSTLLPTPPAQAGATQAIINACYKHTQNQGYIIQQLLSSYGGGAYQTSKVTMRVKNRRNGLLYNATCEYNRGRIRLSQIVPISSGGGTNPRQYYERGYRQGQADAKAGRRYDPVASSYELRPELAREYTRGYANGYSSVEFGGKTLLPPKNDGTTTKDTDRGRPMPERDADMTRSQAPTSYSLNSPANTPEAMETGTPRLKPLTPMAQAVTQGYNGIGITGAMELDGPMPSITVLTI